MNGKVKAALQLNDQSSRFRVEMTPDEAAAFFGSTMPYNDCRPGNVVELIERIGEAIPPMQFSPVNPNNGRLSHKFEVGKEHSPVLYIVVMKYYLQRWQAQDWAMLEDDLAGMASLASADEFDTLKNDETVFIYRIWWD